MSHFGFHLSSTDVTEKFTAVANNSLTHNFHHENKVRLMIDPQMSQNKTHTDESVIKCLVMF